MPHSPWAYRFYWDAVDEKLVPLQVDIKTIRAWPNKLTNIRFMQSYQTEWWPCNFEFAIKTEWLHAEKEFKFRITVPLELIKTKSIPMLAAKLNNEIFAKTTEILEFHQIKSLEAHKMLRTFIHKYITEFTVKYSPVKDPKEKEVDLNPYYLLRMLLLIPVIPEEVVHWMYVQEEAMKAQKRILADAEYVKSLQDEHYKKYGTIAEKAKTYLSNFFKK